MILYYIILYYADLLSPIFGCNHSQVATHLAVHGKLGG